MGSKKICVVLIRVSKWVHFADYLKKACHILCKLYVNIKNVIHEVSLSLAVSSGNTDVRLSNSRKKNEVIVSKCFGLLTGVM
jgi:hypothetical protein